MKFKMCSCAWLLASLLFAACGDDSSSASASEVSSSSEEQVMSSEESSSSVGSSSEAISSSVASSSSDGEKHLAWEYMTPAISYGEFTDERDGHVYKYTEFYRYRVLAENLNFADSVNYPNLVGQTWCPYDNLDSCSKYGRYYSWTAAFNAPSEYSSKFFSLDYNGVDYSVSSQGICPEGWLVVAGPRDWEDIFYKVNTPRACVLKGWDVNCTDSLGLSFLPNGYYDNGEIIDMGEAAYIWTPASQQNGSAHLGVFRRYRDWSRILMDKNLGAGVRCFQEIPRVTSSSSTVSLDSVLVDSSLDPIP